MSSARLHFNQALIEERRLQYQLETRYLLQLLNWISMLSNGSGIAPTRHRLAAYWFERHGYRLDKDTAEWRFLLHYEALLDYGFVRESTLDLQTVGAGVAGGMTTRKQPVAAQHRQPLDGGLRTALNRLRNNQQEDIRVDLTIDGMEFIRQQPTQD